jgi:hypothetical protein
VYRSVLSQAGTPIEDATMHKVVAGLAISLDAVAEPAAYGRSATAKQRTERVSHG